MLVRALRRPHRSAILGLATATVAAIATLQASPAEAQTDTHVDAQGDVVSISADDYAFVPEPDRTDSDVRRLRVGHGPGAVVIKVRAVALDPEVNHVVAGRIRTADGDADFEWVQREGRPTKGRFLRADGTRCDAASARFDLGAALVRVRVPRSCLDDPDWVRVGVGLGGFTTLHEGVYLDDARSDQVKPYFVLGPRMLRA